MDGRSFGQNQLNFLLLCETTLTKQEYSIEGLHNAVRTYTNAIFHVPWFPFCMVAYRENIKTRCNLLIFFIPGFHISTK